jgi:hypothetical protein
MATQCLHESMTKKVMEPFGFIPAARDLAARANAEVDEKQGNTADQTNLHSMCGYVDKPFLHIQNDTECRVAVASLLSQERKEIVGNILAGNQSIALRRMGEALHTVQDGAFHRFEPWPFKGIADAFLNNANYMICHAIRDLGLISSLDLSELPHGRFDVQVTQRVGRQFYLSARFFNNPIEQDRYPFPLGRDRREGEAFLGTGGMILFTFGAAPGSVKPRDPIVEERPQSAGESPYWTIVTDGPAAQSRGEDASEEFIRGVMQEVNNANAGSKFWDDFLHLRDTSEPSQLPTLSVPASQPPVKS